MIFTIDKINNLKCKDLERYIKGLSSLYVKTISLTAYYKTENYIKNYLEKNVSLRNVLLNIINDMTITDNGSKYLIDIRNNLLLDDKDCSLTLFKLITYGNRDIKGSHIIINALQYAFNQ